MKTLIKVHFEVHFGIESSLIVFCHHIITMFQRTPANGELFNRSVFLVGQSY